MSILVLQIMAKEHDLLDDLESFLWVLLWAALRRFAHTNTGLLKMELFGETIKSDQGGKSFYSGGVLKLGALSPLSTGEWIQFTYQPLHQLVCELAGAWDRFHTLRRAAEPDKAPKNTRTLHHDTRNQGKGRPGMEHLRKLKPKTPIAKPALDTERVAEEFMMEKKKMCTSEFWLEMFLRALPDDSIPLADVIKNPYEPQSAAQQLHAEVERQKDELVITSPALDTLDEAAKQHHAQLQAELNLTEALRRATEEENLLQKDIENEEKYRKLRYGVHPVDPKSELRLPPVRSNYSIGTSPPPSPSAGRGSRAHQLAHNDASSTLPSSTLSFGSKRSHSESNLDGPDEGAAQPLKKVKRAQPKANTSANDGKGKERMTLRPRTRSASGASTAGTAGHPRAGPSQTRQPKTTMD